MRLTLTVNTIAHPEYNMHQLKEMIGLLPYWVAEHVDSDDGSDLVEFMEERYGFGPLYKFGGEVDKNGSYVSGHEDDDPMPYIGKMITKSGYAYFYSHAIVALPQPNDKHFITRMD